MVLLATGQFAVAAVDDFFFAVLIGLGDGDAVAGHDAAPAELKVAVGKCSDCWRRWESAALWRAGWAVRRRHCPGCSAKRSGPACLFQRSPMLWDGRRAQIKQPMVQIADLQDSRALAGSQQRVL